MTDSKQTDDVADKITISSLQELLNAFRQMALYESALSVNIADTISNTELLKIAHYLALAKQRFGEQAPFGGADELKQMLADRGLPTPEGL